MSASNERNKLPAAGESPTKKAKTKDSEQIAVYYEPAEASDISEAAALEAASYPEDEAASLKSLQYRQQHACDFFLMAWRDLPPSSGTQEGEAKLTEGSAQEGKCKIKTGQKRKLAGFVVGTLTDSPQLKHETMSLHLPDGAYLCIHSVVISADHRRIGLGSAMLKHYIRHVQQLAHRSKDKKVVKKILLITKKNLISFYEGVGFNLYGPSSVVHGKMQWYECGMDLVSESQPAPPPSSANTQTK
eukprot:gb/GEZN01014036.1/.p1 GENE.gb/GEZN01014036.1/~~gb/GEZN01014036.1/.p1  ORF type:complete len:245 (+),score=51.97 gb/GEZN01014036.1/:151-885(+)